MNYISWLLPFILLTGLYCGASTEFVVTNQTYPSLSADAQVQVYVEKLPQNYTEIGLLLVKGAGLEDRLRTAKRKARESGGNGLIVRDTRQNVNIHQDAFTGRVSSHSVTEQEFLVIRVISD